MKEVIGLYTLNEVYVDMVQRDLSEQIRTKVPKPTILLRADGTASIARFPVFASRKHAFDYAFEGYEDFEARWKISAVGSVSSGGDDLKTVYGIAFEPADTSTLFDSPTLTGADSVKGLIFTLYDGDQGQILGFTKNQ